MTGIRDDSSEWVDDRRGSTASFRQRPGLMLTPVRPRPSANKFDVKRRLTAYDEALARLARRS